MMTTPVESNSSLYLLNPFSLGSHGQEAFCSSTFTSLKKLFVFVSMGKKRSSKHRTSNAEHRTPNCLQLHLSSLDVGCSTLCSSTRQEGLEPPTDGFGDRYSTN